MVPSGLPPQIESAGHGQLADDSPPGGNWAIPNFAMIPKLFEVPSPLHLAYNPVLGVLKNRTNQRKALEAGNASFPSLL